MAAQAVTVTRTNRVATKLGQGVGVLFGRVDITNYHQTAVEITDITNYFRSDVVISMSGVSDNGYHVAWESATGTFKAYYPTAGAIAVTAGTAGDAVTNNAGVLESTGGQDLAVTSAAGTEVATDVDVGAFDFLAFGIVI